MDDCSGRVVVPHSDSIHELGDDGEFLTSPATTMEYDAGIDASLDGSCICCQRERSDYAGGAIRRPPIRRRIGSAATHRRDVAMMAAGGGREWLASAAGTDERRCGRSQTG
jgi:hypothetical protein